MSIAAQILFGMFASIPEDAIAFTTSLRVGRGKCVVLGGSPTTGVCAKLVIASCFCELICFFVAGDYRMTLDPSEGEGTGATDGAVEEVTLLGQGVVSMGFCDSEVRSAAYIGSRR